MLHVIDGFLKVDEVPPNMLELTAIQSKATDIEFDIKMLRLELDAYHLWCSVLENANQKQISFSRQNIISINIKNLQDSKNQIQDLTDGVTVEQYLLNHR